MSDEKVTPTRLREMANAVAEGGPIRVMDRLDIAMALHVVADLRERAEGER